MQRSGLNKYSWKDSIWLIPYNIIQISKVKSASLKLWTYFQMLVTDYAIKRKLIRALQGLYKSIWEKKLFLTLRKDTFKKIKKGDLKICMNFEMISQTADNSSALLTVLLKWFKVQIKEHFCEEESFRWHSRSCIQEHSQRKRQEGHDNCFISHKTRFN